MSSTFLPIDFKLEIFFNHERNLQLKDFFWLGAPVHEGVWAKYSPFFT